MGLVFWVMFPLWMFAQPPSSPYRLSPCIDGPLLTAGLGLSITGFVLDRTTIPFSPDDVIALDPNSVPRFDRYSTRQGSKGSAIASDVFFYGAGLAPLGMLANKRARNDWWILGVMYSEVFLLNTGFTLTTKGTVLRPRPLVFNADFPMEDKTTLSARHSFYSGHTSTTSSMCFFTAKVWSDYHPDSRLKPLVWTAAAAVPAAVGFFRVQAGKHYPTDVITGYFAGALVGLAVPMLHKKRDTNWSVVPFSGNSHGVQMVYRFLRDWMENRGSRSGSRCAPFFGSDLIPEHGQSSDA